MIEDPTERGVKREPAGRWRRRRVPVTAIVASSLVSRFSLGASIISLRSVSACLASLALMTALPRAAAAQRHLDDVQYEPLFGARFGGAQHQSILAGVARLSDIRPSSRSGLALEVEAGRSAGQVGLGFLVMHRYAPHVRGQLVGLRTWRRATDIAPGQTFVGVETQVSMLLGASVGHYRRVHGSVPGDKSFTAIRFVVGI